MASSVALLQIHVGVPMMQQRQAVSVRSLKAGSACTVMVRPDADTSCLTDYTVKKEKEKTTPFGVNLMRSPVLYRAAQETIQYMSSVKPLHIQAGALTAQRHAVCL